MLYSYGTILKTNENDIADLFQFANFTRDYPEEAAAVFLSDNFNIPY